MKNIIKLFAIIVVVEIVAFMGARRANAADFIPAPFYLQNEDINLPIPKPALEETVGIDLKMSVPFNVIKKAFLKAAQTREEIKLNLIEEQKPVIVRSENSLIIKNIIADIGGIIAKPVVTIEPFLESDNVIAVKIKRIKLRVSMSPSKSIANFSANFSEEQLMKQMMNAMAKGIINALDDNFRRRNIPLRADDVINFSYNETEWILRIAIASDFLEQYLFAKDYFIAGLIGDLHLVDFSFNDTAILINLKTYK